MAWGIAEVRASHVLDYEPEVQRSCRLFMKGARNLEFDKLREICGDYQQLSYANGSVQTLFKYDQSC